MPETPTQSQSWSLCDVKGTREDLIEQINAAEFVPSACKAMFCEAVKEIKNPAKLFKLDVHVFAVDTHIRGVALSGNWSLSAL